jgi:hypothetical protein
LYKDLLYFKIFRRDLRLAVFFVFHCRSSFIYGYNLGMDELAFSPPTIDGKAFAEKYTGTVNYLVID